MKSMRREMGIRAASLRTRSASTRDETAILLAPYGIHPYT